MDSMAGKGHLSAIFATALIVLTPLSGIPGLSTICGLLIAVLSFEMIFGPFGLRLPKSMNARTIPAERAERAIARLMPIARWIDARTKPRLAFLFHRPLIWLPQSLCLLTGAAMPFLEFIPFSSSIAAASICLLVISLLSKDGVVFLIALMPYSALACIFLAI